MVKASKVSDWIERLRKESTKDAPMTPRTVRLDRELDDEIHNWCAQNGVSFAVLVRDLVAEGWERKKAANG